MVILHAGKAAQATRAAQGLLSEQRTDLKVDGHWGSFTQQAFANANSTLQTTVRQTVASFGSDYTPENLRDHFVSQKAAVEKTVGKEWISEEYAMSLLERAVNLLGAARYGITTSNLRDFLFIEPIKQRDDSGRWYFKTTSALGSYRGLYQMGKGAWLEALKVPGARDQMGDYANAFDPWCNTVAMVGYAIQNVRTARDVMKYDGAITGQLLYGMHNQGAAGRIRQIRGQASVVGQQSKIAMNYMATGRLA